MAFPGPFSPGHVVTAAEWNAAQTAHEDEVTRATAAEAALDTRVDGGEAFALTTQTVLPVKGSNEIRMHFGIQAISFNSGATIGADPFKIGSVTSGPAAGQELWLELMLPRLCTITGVEIAIVAANYTGLPSTMPKAQVVEYDPATGTATTVVADFSDPTAVLGTFNTRHQFATTPTPVTIGRKRYFLKFNFGSGGTGASASLDLVGVDIGVTGPA